MRATRTTADEERQRRSLPGNYWKLWWASAISNVGDGIDVIAIPLLAEALTRDPTLFAGVAVAGRLPWLLFSLHAGAIADRVDRRRLMVAVNVGRFALMGVLGTAVLGDWVTIWLLYAISFLLGVAETLFDNASQTILPSIVEPEDLEFANGRLFAGEIVTNQFVGPPLGGLLFGVAAALPILLDAGTFLVSAGLVFAVTGQFVSDRRRVAAPPRSGDQAIGHGPVSGPVPGPDVAVAATHEAPAATPTRMWDEIREGLAWLRGHRLLRTLALLLGVMNGTIAMLFAVYPLFAVGPESVLRLSPFGFGVLETTAAVGSVVGSLTATWLAQRLGRAVVLWVTLASAVIVPGALAVTSSVAVVGVAFAFSGFAGVAWNVITVSLRQTVIPDDLLGRVNSVYRFAGWGAMPIGSLAGGLLAGAFGLRAPFVAAAAVSLVAIVPAARIVTASTIEQARAAAPSRSG